MRYKKFTRNILLFVAIGSLLQPSFGQTLTASYFAGNNRKLWVFLKQSDTKSIEAITYPAKTRARLRSNGWTKDRTDYALPVQFVEKIGTHVDSLRVCSRILRAVSVAANYAQYKDLRKMQFVEKIEPVARFKKQPERLFNLNQKSLAKKGEYGSSYDQLNQIGLIKLHEAGLTGAGVRIALLDAGFNKRHEAFEKILAENRLVATRDFVFGDEVVLNQNQWDHTNNQERHGTSVWSLIGAYEPGQMMGGAYNAEFILGKTEKVGSETVIEEDYYIAGVEWADSLGADIISSSLGYRDFENFSYKHLDLDGQTARTTRAVNWASQRGILCVTAAGNDRLAYDDGGLVTPGDSPSALTVGAVDSSGNIAYFSSHGPTADGRIKPDLCALGVGNYVANSRSNTSYAFGNGTSYATPLMAAGCALLLERYPFWSPDSVISELKKYASLAGQPDSLSGWGIPDFYTSYQKNLNIPSIPADIAENEVICGPNPISLNGGHARFFYHNAGKIVDRPSKIYIYNVLGQIVFSHENTKILPEWNLKNNAGQKVASGIYIVRLKFDGRNDRFGKISIIF